MQGAITNQAWYNIRMVGHLRASRAHSVCMKTFLHVEKENMAFFFCATYKLSDTINCWLFCGKPHITNTSRGTQHTHTSHILLNKFILWTISGIWKLLTNRPFIHTLFATVWKDATIEWSKKFHGLPKPSSIFGLISVFLLWHSFIYSVRSCVHLTWWSNRDRIKLFFQFREQYFFYTPRWIEWVEYTTMNPIKDRPIEQYV